MKITLRVAAVLVPVLALVGCGSGGAPNAQGTAGTTARPSASATSSSSATRTPVTPRSTAPSPSSSASSASPTGAPVPGVTFTPADARLALGQKAVVPFALGDHVGAVSVRVTSVDVGDPADLAAFNLGDRGKGLTPYYVRVTVTNETDANFAYSSLGLTTPVLGDGSPAQHIDVIGHFDRCPNGYAGKDFTTKGTQYQTCVLGLAASGTQVAGLAYRGSAYGKVLDEPDYGLHPVIWSGRPGAPPAATGPSA